MTVRINLVPGEKPARARKRAAPGLPRPGAEWLPRSPAVLVGVGGLAVVLGLVFFYFGERRAVSALRAEIVEAEADSARLHSAVVRVRAMEEAQIRLAAQVEVMESVVEGRLYWIELMELLSRDLPEYTWLERVDREELADDQVRITGSTFSNAAVTEYMRGLEGSPLLEDVTLIGVNRSVEDSISYQNFTLVGTFEQYRPVVVAPADTTQGGP